MGIFFAIFSPALYSISNFIDKFLLEKYRLHPTVITMYSGCIAFLTGIIIAFFTGFGSLDVGTAGILVVSGMLTLFYMLPYFKALSLDEASRIVPLFQLTPVIVLVLSNIFLQESFSIKQYIGAASIIIASLLLSVEKISFKIFALRKAFWYMLFASFLYALSIILFKVGLNAEINFWKALPYEGTGIAIAAVVVSLLPGNKKIILKTTKKLPRKVFAYMALNEGIFILSRYIGFFALTLISVSLLSIINGLQPLFLFIYGIMLSLFFPHIVKESLKKHTLILKSVAMVGILIGIVLLFT